MLASAYDDLMGGGLSNVCTEGGSQRVTADAWLGEFPAELQPDPCGDGFSLRLLVSTAEGDAIADPGSRGLLGDVEYVFPEARCEVFGTSEDWRFSVLLWR